ncbi:uncharacterized protein BJ212DRAFT_1483080 [Suillus subaureus]|uniref:Uncharacterized protein n=1 Tax=Suillus subaureus TaxID=48587 RepID=A0A9P7E6R8_9AGAM|nr:uncharacterized protein BJ212DRAFT_1483080 [Suillus subaureus]KAG1812447.1 hypothetical protein BJ212DRAFT_1483080 [Suillus subaureus]
MAPKKHSRSISVSSQSSISSNSNRSSLSSSEDSHTPPSKKQVKKCVCTDKEASKQKKAKKSKTSKEDPHKEYLATAHGITHCIDLFCKVDKLIKIGCLLQQEEAAEKGELKESEAEKETHKKRLSAISEQKKLASGGIRLTTNGFPTFLWSGNPPGCDYDDDTMTEGLLQGYLIECVMRHIFTGPSTALAEHIAYACVQAHFGISAQNKWSDIDGNFKYPEFYHNIIDFIHDCGDTDWVGELKKWWNMVLFKNKASREGRPDAWSAGDEYRRDSSGSVNNLAKMQAQVMVHTKSSAAPAAPDPPPPCPITPPPSSPAPTRAGSLPPTPLPPAPQDACSTLPSSITSGSCKSPALSELTDDKGAPDDITNRKAKWLGGKTHSKGKGKQRCIEDSDDEEVQQPAKHARKQTHRR